MPPLFRLAPLLLALASSFTFAALPASVDRELTRVGIAPENVAIWVQAVDGDTPVLAVNAQKALNPASTMKLVTAFAALERLGPAHTWNTRIATTGTVADGRLAGNLHVVGGGDPMLSYDRLWKLLDRVRASGIRHIDGDIVLDGSALRLSPHDASAFDGRGLRPYNSGASGLLLHFNTVHLHLQPGESAGHPVAVVALPALKGLAIDNRIVTAAGACGVWHRDLDASLETSAAGSRLILTGSLRASCGPRDWSAAPFATEAFATALVASLWAEGGSSLSGTVRWGVTPEIATTRFEAISPTLAEVVREMNKWSSNVIARQLLATLGSGNPDSADMSAEGIRVTLDTLAAVGIPVQGLVLENGAGLSRIERIRADALGAVLITAWRRPWMPEFMSALSLAGLDGTARKRLESSPARGRAHLKTGTINGVRAVAGYVLDRNGRRHAVVMMVNDPNAPNSEAAQDALIEWVWGGAGK